MWVCLQNCHLAVSWLPTLQNLVEELSLETTHADFRLWLTSCPSDAFPISILEKSVKMTVEPPTGIRANIAMCYTGYDNEWFEDCRRPHEFKKMLFSLCFFHALIRARRKFGPLGWNIPYAFSIPDLKISTDQLRLFLDLETDNIPFKLLQYCTAECNYGGRVTDDKDRRCLKTILTDFYTADVFDDDYRYSILDQYYAPQFGNIQSYLDYADTLPINEPPELFGLHPNANITCAITESNTLLKIALSLQPRTGGGGSGSGDSVLGDIASKVADRIPVIFDVEKVEVAYPTDYMEAMNTVLTQELVRFNELLEVVKKDLVDIQLALKGELAMSTALEALGTSMVNTWVPERWMNVCYPSLKPLASWVADLLRRLNMLQMWIDQGSPATYWVSGFFFTQAFLTGTRQNFARKYEIAIDDTGYDFRFFNASEAAAITAKDVKADDGCYCYGLFVDGARYDNETKVVKESLPKALVGAPSTVLPLALLLPSRAADIKNAEESHRYECPVYKTSKRQGMLSTTGHSTNFVIMLMIPMGPDDSQKKWIKQGVACLTQTDD
jgi:dynein heavy chain